MPAQISFQIVQRLTLNLALHGFDEIGHCHVQALHIGQVHGGEESAPVESGAQRLQIGSAHLVINVFGIAAQRAIHGALGQVALHGHHRLRVFGGGIIGLAHQLEHVGDVLHVLFALLGKFAFVLDVVVPIGQA